MLGSKPVTGVGADVGLGVSGGGSEVEDGDIVAETSVAAGVDGSVLVGWEFPQPNNNAVNRAAVIASGRNSMRSISD